jgi:hypothetical protein
LEGGKTSDAKSSKVGIRKLRYNQDFLALRDVSKVNDLHSLTGATATRAAANPLIIACNGQRIMLKGADSGMDEGMLRCDREGY